MLSGPYQVRPDILDTKYYSLCSKIFLFSWIWWSQRLQCAQVLYEFYVLKCSVWFFFFFFPNMALWCILAKYFGLISRWHCSRKFKVFSDTLFQREEVFSLQSSKHDCAFINFNMLTDAWRAWDVALEIFFFFFLQFLWPFHGMTFEWTCCYIHWCKYWQMP